MKRKIIAKLAILVATLLVSGQMAMAKDMPDSGQVLGPDGVVHDLPDTGPDSIYDGTNDGQDTGPDGVYE